jgi:hypothetical protein
VEAKQSLWPYALAIVSALLAPGAFRYATEEPKVTPGVVATAPKPEARVPPKPEEPGLEQDWIQFLCSYANPKLPSGRYCDPAVVPEDTEFLIAGVPDPEATSIPATFDVMVEALIGAAAAEEWRYDRYWLPWGHKTKDETKATPANPSLTNDQPGLLLFRRDDKLLLVFLVGETPTAGVSKTALFKAAKFVFEHQGKLRILGPRFSGSVPSYKQTLRRLADLEALAPVHFVTGSATREANRQDLLPYLFEATIENDSLTRDLFLDWLGTRGIGRGQVALLSEAGTAFGAAFRAGDADPMLKVEFPYQISRLRNAYEKDPELRAIWMDTSAQAKDNKLEWSLKSEKDGTDGVPAFQGPQVTLLQERQLEQITHAIRRRGIRAAAINATDVLDTVFLTLLLRRRCPDVRVFTLDSDLLFTYASGALSFNGMLMVSPYSHWLDSTLHFKPAGPRFLNAAPNRSAIGVHNAFIRLMNGKALAGYWSPLNGARPPLWVTAIGRGQVWPLAVLDDRAEPSKSQLIPGANPRSLEFPWTIQPDWTYWALLCVFSGLVVYAFAVYAARRLAEWGWIEDFDPAFFCLFEPPDRSFERTAYVLIACALGFVALLPFSIRLGWGLCAMVATMFAVTALGEPLRGRTLRLTLALGAAIAIPVAFWVRHLLSAADHERFFFEYRLLHPASGLSPLTPWALAWIGCAWWAVMRINLLRAREVRSPRLESWPDGEPILGGLGRIVQEAAAVTGPQGFRKRFVLAVLILFVMVWWAFPDGLGSLEHGMSILGWAAGVTIAIYLLTLLVLQVLVHLFLTQRSAMDLLNALVDHPLGDAFDRLPKELAASKLWVRGGNRHSFQSIVQGVKRLRLMPAVAANYPKVEPALSRVLDRAAAERRVQSTDVGELHESLNRIAIQIYPALTETWKHPEAKKLPAEEEFIALRLAALLRHLVIQMRSMMEYLSFGLVMLIFAVISYPFEPQNGLVYMVAAMVAATGLTVFYTVTRLDRHPVMQKFASQKETPSFADAIRKVAAFGFAPLVATFTALFPGTVRSLSSLIEAAGKYLGN